MPETEAQILSEMLIESIFVPAGKALAELEELLLRAHAPEPGDGKKAAAALQRLNRDGFHQWPEREYLEDCKAVIEIRQQIVRRDELNQAIKVAQAEYDGHFADFQAASTRQRGIDGHTTDHFDFGACEARMRDAASEVKRLMSQCVSVENRLKNAMLRTPRGLAVLRAARVDVRVF